MEADALPTVRALLDPSAAPLLAEAGALVAAGSDDLAVLTRLRRTASPDLAGAALRQARLRVRAAAKLGDDAAALWFTPTGLEQATRAEVAAHRAARLAAALGPDGSVLDLGAGLGVDTLALARAGLRVRAVERDPVTAAFLRANTTAYDVTVVEGDGLDLLADAPEDVVYADPARREGDRRTVDPERASPPLSALVAGGRSVVVKAAPALGHEHVPPGWEAEWVSTRTSDGRSTVEACLWSPPLAGAARRASVLPLGSLSGEPDADLPVGPVGRYLHEPDGAVLRARLVRPVLEAVGGHLLHPRIGYLTSDTDVRSPYAACFEVLEAVPLRTKALVAAVRAYGPRDVTVKKRGIDLDPAVVRRELLRGRGTGAPLTVVVARLDDGPTAFLTRFLTGAVRD